MKKIRLIMAGTFCLFMSAAFAQESSDLDTTKHPVRQGDPAVRQSPEQIQENTLRDMVEISESEIPSDMQNALKGKDYQGESKTFYKSKDGESYAVEIKDGNITQTYRFNKQGKVINDRNR
jgi:ribosomal protein L21E